MPEMQCEKCGSTDLRKKKVFRLSGCLAAIGYTLWVPAVVILLIAILLSVGLVGAAGEVGTQIEEETRAEAVAALRQIEGVPPTVVASFQEDGIIEQAELDSLPNGVRQQVRSVLVDHDLGKAAEGVGAAVGVAAGGVLVTVMYVYSLPALIVGLLLTLKKKVWRCQECGYSFERN